MSDSSERYEVRHYTDACWPHTCATAADLPALILTLWGRLRTPEEREAVRRAIGVTCVVAVAVPRGTSVEDAAANLERATDAHRHGVPQSHNDYSSAGTPSGSPDAAGVSVLDRAG